MKLCITLVALTCYLVLAFGCNTSSLKSASASLSAVIDGRVPKDDYLLSTNAKKPDEAPPVPFSHANHANKNYSIDGTRPITCVECHHTDQPASEAAKNPPLKSAFPADRTTTLTADLLQKDPKAPDVLGCQACHAQEGSKPRSWPEMPKILYEGDTDPTYLNSEEAYHRNCNSCHDQVAELRPKAKLPTSKQCAECHSGKK